jgi:lipid-A-disaccharide synthase
MKNVLIVAGEASGDHHGARLVEETLKLKPDIHFSGIGGEHMRKAGVETLVDSAEMAVVGLIEVLAHRKTIFGALDLMRERVKTQKPDLLILIDYPDFNLRLAKTAREAGVKVLFYISPQVWAWRQKRVFKIKELVDMMAVVFPFEVPFYKNAGVPVTFVGHPLVDEVKSSLSHNMALSEFNLNPGQKVLGLFPGSRKSEIKRLLPLLLETAQRLHTSDPTIQFILPRATTLKQQDLEPYLADNQLDIKIVSGRPYDVMRACDAIITASGTATLEISLMEIPLVVVYKMNALSYRIISRMIKVDNIALCNIVAGERIAPELLQNQANVETVSRYALDLLTDHNGIATEMRAKQKLIREKLGESGASEKVAQLVLEQLNNA